MTGNGVLKILAKTIGLFLYLLVFLSKAQYISVSSNYTAEQLVKDIFIGQQNASCITVDNITVSGWDFGNGDLSYGYFNQNGSSFEVNDGILLSSGKISEAVGSFAGIQSATASGWNGDRDLEIGARITNTTDATFLEFDFISHQSDKISFDYMFLSEQYLRNGDPGTCGYTDGFAFLIKKDGDSDYTNIAVIPGTNIPITSENVRGYGGRCSANNEQYFGHYNPDYSPVSFNGQTAILTAKTDVIPGQKYHIKLVIADQGNGLYDSGVVLRAGSFTGNVDIGNDLTIEGSNPLCENQVYRIEPKQNISDPSSQYYWYKDGTPINVPITQNYYDVTDVGIYSVNIILGSGCKLQGSVKIEKAPEPDIDSSAIMICDNDFDGKYTAKLSEFNNQIVRNYSRDFSVSYYSNSSASGVPINPDSDFTFTQNPQTLYVKVSTFSCSPKIYPVQFYWGSKVKFSNFTPFDICDNDINGNEDINLADFVDSITNESNVIATYYDSETDAKSGNNAKSPFKTIRADITYYIRIEKDGFCPNYTAIKFVFKQPKKSAILEDKPICKGSVTDLDAGSGFDSYEWSNGETTQEIKNIPAGDYWVKLGFNGCVYQQSVSVKEAEEPVIDNILIDGNTVTVLVSGGKSPYLYAIDNGNYQSFNIFTNVPMGSHEIYVKSSDGCYTITKNFSLINAINVITPNDDGKNDIIDYSSLLTKTDPKFEVYDRNGVLVFKGDTANQFIWKGKLNGRVLPTASYWYILEWNEAGNSKRVQLTGWILLKNRE